MFKPVFRCVLVIWVGGVAVVLAIQPSRLSSQTLDSKHETLVTRIESGDRGARNELGLFARGLATDAAERRLDPATARQVARVTLAMAGPLSPPDSGVTPRELEWRGGAVRALRMALAGDSADAWSAAQLERLTPYPFLWYAAPQQLRQLRGLAARVPRMPDALALTRLQLELEAGSPDSAMACLRRLAPGVVSNAGAAHLLAETEFAEGHDSLAAAAYFRGAALIGDSSDASWYTRDLSWITTHDELQEWLKLQYRTGDRRRWLEAFWARKDLVDGRLPGTRLAEQFRRWRIALRDFRWDHDGSVSLGIPVIPGAGKESSDDADMTGLQAMNRLHSLTRVLDDRGGLILRHGEPIQKACGVCVPAMNDRETWKWLTPGGPLLVGFSYTESQRYGMVARNVPQGNSAELCHLDTYLCVRTRERNRLIRLKYTSMRDSAEHTDGNAETYREPLGAMIQVYGIANGGSLVVIAVPAIALAGTRKVLDTARTFTIQLRALVGDSAAGTVVATFDTIATWRSTTKLSSETFLTAAIAVPAPVGRWGVAVVLGDSGHRAGTGQRFSGVPVERFDGRTLRIGDPILGREGTMVWQHDGAAIPLNPANAWRRDQAVILSFDLDGLVPSRAYETAIEVWNQHGTQTAASMSMKAGLTATSTRQSIRRDIALTSLSTGDYRLVVRVRDATTGAEVVRERRLAVRK